MFETLHKSFPGIHTEPRVAIKLVRVNICNTRSVRQASRLCDLRLLRDLQPERLKRIKLFSWKDSQGPAHPLPPCNCMTFSHDILNCVYVYVGNGQPSLSVIHLKIYVHRCFHRTYKYFQDSREIYGNCHRLVVQNIC